MTPLQIAAQDTLDRWDAPLNKVHMGMEALRKALADEKAQAVEPVAYFNMAINETVGCIAYEYEKHNLKSGTPLYTQPAPPTTGERAELIAAISDLRRHIWDLNISHSKEMRDLLLSGTSAQQVAVTKHMEEQPDGTINEVVPWVAQQGAVPCSSLCELCIKRGYIACANAAKTTPLFAQQPQKPVAQQVAVPEIGNTTCNPHPEAPHGFDRNASHSAGRYVCDCEGWVP